MDANLVPRLTNSQKKIVTCLYLDGKLNSPEISKRYGCHKKTITSSVKKNGGTLRSRRIFKKEKEKIITCLYIDGKQTIFHLASRYNSHPTTIINVIKRQGGKTRKQFKENHPNWKGGKQETSEGYILKRIYKDDPLYCMSNGKDYVLEHRLVMARYLERPLLQSEQVHHINGKKSDNRIENLQLMINSHGNGVLYECAECKCRKLNPCNL